MVSQANLPEKGDLRMAFIAFKNVIMSFVKIRLVTKRHYLLTFSNNNSLGIAFV